jgi:hypothetical protein
LYCLAFIPTVRPQASVVLLTAMQIIPTSQLIPLQHRLVSFRSTLSQLLHYVYYPYIPQLSDLHTALPATCTAYISLAILPSAPYYFPYPLAIILQPQAFIHCTYIPVPGYYQQAKCPNIIPDISGLLCPISGPTVPVFCLGDGRGWLHAQGHQGRVVHTQVGGQPRHAHTHLVLCREEREKELKTH